MIDYWSALAVIWKSFKRIKFSARANDRFLRHKTYKKVPETFFRCLCASLNSWVLRAKNIPNLDHDLDLALGISRFVKVQYLHWRDVSSRRVTYCHSCARLATFIQLQFPFFYQPAVQTLRNMQSSNSVKEASRLCTIFSSYSAPYEYFLFSSKSTSGTVTLRQVS